jgi:HSP20 family protein
MQDKRVDRERGWVVQGFAVWQTRRQYVPPTDVLELPDKLLVQVEIAGMRSQDFSITLYDTRLVISGTRERPTPQNAAYHQVEIGYGPFRVEIMLPWSVNRDDVTASYKDGFLQVELPRRDHEQVHYVDVHTDQQEES